MGLINGKKESLVSFSNPRYFASTVQPSPKGKENRFSREKIWQTVPGKFPFPIPQNVEVPILLVRNVGESINAVGKKQFLIQTLVSSKGEERYPQILIDTGAQPNLVRKGLFPSYLFHSSMKPLQLRAANQKRIHGGKEVVPLTFTFHNSSLGKDLHFKGLFYEADIPVDIICSNGWMGENKIIPLPEFSQLGEEITKMCIFYHPFVKIGGNRSWTHLPCKFIHQKDTMICFKSSTSPQIFWIVTWRISSKKCL